MFLAPLLVVLIPVAVVLWPPVLLILGVLVLLTWPLAAIGNAAGIAWLPRMHAALKRWFIVLLRPWRYFDAPKVPANQPEPSEPSGATEPPPPAP
jgi:hypothetical protein